MSLKKVLASTIAAVLAVGSMAVCTSAADTYQAGIVFQTQSWMYRNDLTSDEVSEGGVEADDFEVVDVEITKDGEYTVEVSGIPEDTGDMHSLGLYTTIPGDKAGTIKITKVEADGADTGFTADTTVGVENADEADKLVKINLINEWNDDVKDSPAIENKPYTSVKITFTVTGLFEDENPATGDDNAATGDENPATSDAAGDTDKPSDDKNSPDTGVEGVAIVAGLAVIAAGAVVVAKKRK